MAQVLTAPRVQYSGRMSSVEEAISKCNPTMQRKLIYINAALRFQQFYREQGDKTAMLEKHKEVVTSLDKLGEASCSQFENEFLGSLWERAGKQLQDTACHSEQYHCFIRAMNHYEHANNSDKSLQVFRNLYRK